MFHVCTATPTSPHLKLQSRRWPPQNACTHSLHLPPTIHLPHVPHMPSDPHLPTSLAFMSTATMEHTYTCTASPTSSPLSHSMHAQKPHLPMSLAFMSTATMEHMHTLTASPTSPPLMFHTRMATLTSPRLSCSHRQPPQHAHTHSLRPPPPSHVHVDGHHSTYTYTCTVTPTLHLSRVRVDGHHSTHALTHCIPHLPLTSR